MNNQANEVHRQQVRTKETGWLQALLRIAQNAMTMPRDELCQEVAATACDMLNGVVSIVWTLDKSKEEFRIAAWAGEIDEDYRTQVTISAQATATDKFLKGRRPIYLSDVTDANKAPFYTAGHRAEAQRRGWVSLLSAPMIAEDQAVGILDVYTGQVRRFTSEERDLLNTFASQAALTMRHAGIEEQRAQMLNNLQEISALSLVSRRGAKEDIQNQFADRVVTAVHNLTGDDVAIWLPDETRRQWKIWAHVGLREEYVERARVGLDDSVSGQALRTRQPIALFDISDPRNQPAFKYLGEADKMGWQSVMIVPLLTPERALGTLSVYSHNQRDFAQWEQDLLSTFANQAAIAFENVRRQQNLEDLVRTGETMTRETVAGLRPLLEKAARSACELTGADYAAIYPYDPARQLFYDLENVVVYGLEKPRYPKEKPRERGLAAVVRDIDELVVHDVDVGELGPVDFGRVKVPSVDKTRLLDFIREEKFIQEEEVKSLVGLSLKAGPSTNGKEQEVGVLYIDFCRPHHFTEEELDLIRIFGHQVGSAIQNAHLLERERHLRRQAETLREVSSAISSQIELKELTERILDELGKVIEYRKASIQLIQGDTRTLIAGRGFDEKAVNEWFLRPISQDCLINRIVTSNEPLILSDPSKDADWEVRPETANIKSWAGLPLVYGKETLGLLTLDHDQTGYYTDAIRELLTLFCNQAAIAIRNARLHTDLERQIKRLQTLNQVSRELSSKLDDVSIFQAAVKAVLITLDCTHCTAFVLENDMLVPRASYGKDEDVRITRCFAWGEGLAGWVAQKGTAVLAQDAKKHEHFREGGTRPDAERSMIVVPVTVSGQVIGVISADQDRVNAFDERDLQMVEAIALQAGSALQNTRLLKQERQRAEAMDLLQRVSAGISETLDVEETLRVIIEGAMRLTGTESGVIHLINKDKSAVIRSYEIPEDFGHLRPRFSEEKGMTWTIVSEGEMITVPDITVDDRVNPKMAEKGVKALIGTPLAIEGETIGALFLNDTRSREFTEYEQDLLSNLAGQAAIAISNARLFTDAQRRIRDLEIVNEVAQIVSTELDTKTLFKKIVSEIADKLRCTHCTLFFPQEEKGELWLVPQETHGVRPEIMSRRFKVGDPKKEGLAGWAFRTGKSLALPNAKEDKRFAPARQKRDAPRSMLIVPVKVGDRTIGVISADQDEYDHFTEGDQRLVEAMARHAGIAIERVRERNLLRTLIDNLPDYIYAKDSESRFTLANTATARLVGKTKPDEILGKTDFDFFPRELAVRYRADEEEIMRSGQPLVSLEEPVMDHAGNKQWVLTTKVPLRDSHGNIAGLVGLNRDITERKQAEEVLEERARQLVRLQEVTTTISAEPSNLEKVLDLILENLSKIFQGASCAIRLYDSEPDLFKPLKATGVLEGLADRSPRRNGTSRYAVKTKAPRYLEEEALVRPLDGGPAVRQELVKKGVKAFAYLPLISKGDVIGILYVALVEAYRFSQHDKKILKLFADQAAIAIENARLYEQLQEELRRTKELSQLGEDLANLEQAF